MADVEWSVADGVGVIVLNRSERKNALTLPMIAECVDLVRDAGRDDNVRVLVLTGSGDDFCAGADFAALADDNSGTEGRPAPLAAKQALERGLHPLLYSMDAFDKPLIAAVNGVAIGAGLGLALMCDFRFAAASARLSAGYIKVGLVPGDGSSYTLPRLVGTERALGMLMTGDFVDADNALRIGLVGSVVAPDRLMTEATGYARRLAQMPPVHLQLIKRSVRESSAMSLRGSLELASSHMAIVRSMRDADEAMTSFRERRPGSYIGA